MCDCCSGIKKPPTNYINCVEYVELHIFSVILIFSEALQVSPVRTVHLHTTSLVRRINHYIISTVIRYTTIISVTNH